MAERLDQSLTPESYARVLDHNAKLGQPGGLGPPDGAPFITEVYDQPCKDGSIKHIEITTAAVTDGTGRLVSIVGVSRDVTNRTVAERERAVALAELQEALASVRTLSGLLPICMYCKKIRNDDGYWDRIEKYLGEHTDALLSHGMCPDCYEQYALPELDGAEAGPAG